MKVSIKAGQALVYDGQIIYRTDQILIGSLIDYSAS